jgi:hypothetical protein
VRQRLLQELCIFEFVGQGFFQPFGGFVQDLSLGSASSDGSGARL